MPEKRPPRDIDEWRLGIEPTQPGALPLETVAAPTLAPPDPSALRLERPVHVVTVEHLGWAAIALYALATRLGMLGLRPLSRREAWGSLFALDIARHGLTVLGLHPQAGSGWIEPLRGVVMMVLGASDYSARLIPALFGLALIAVSFAMRRHLGRAGALALAAMLTWSPTLTYFSRSTSPVVPAIALILIALTLAFALSNRADTARVVAFALVIALALSANFMAFAVAAMFVGVLIVFGLWELIFTRNPLIRFRIWWTRHSAMFIVGAAITIGLFVALQSGLGRRPLLTSVTVGGLREWRASTQPDFRAGLSFYLPPLALYEFLIVILGLFGAFAFIAFRIRSRFAAAAFLWTIFSAALLFADPVHRPQWLVTMLVPAAIVGAAAIDWLHHTEAWRFIRFPLAALAILTLYTQVMANFVYFAPDSTEARWARHMVLFWTEPTATRQVEQECNHAERAVTDRAMVFFATDNAVVQWYLRRLTQSQNVAASAVVVSPVSDPKQANGLETYEFTLEENWDPNLAGLKLGSGLRYLATQRAWSPVSSTDVRIEVRSPTQMAPPAETPAPATSETPAPIPSAVPTPTASPSTVPSTPTTTPSPAAASTPASAA